MISGTAFRGDHWYRVMGIQHDTYGGHVGFLLDTARRVYLKAETLLGVSTVPGILVEADDGFDHRVLQNMHDIIAASFRFYRANRLHPELPFPGQEDDTRRIEALWNEYYTDEVRELMQSEPHLARAVVVAVAFQNTDIGYAAEDQGSAILLNHYADIPWLRRIPELPFLYPKTPQPS